ncbi:peroxidase family protein [Chryseobacterium sp. TY4]
MDADVPAENLIWQDTLPKVDYTLNKADIADLKQILLNTGLSKDELINTSWDSARTYRGSEYRGGANGAKIRLEPQRCWVANELEKLNKVLAKLEEIQAGLAKKISIADLIGLGGTAALEKAAQESGYNIRLPCVAGRGDALFRNKPKSSLSNT